MVRMTKGTLMNKINKTLWREKFTRTLLDLQKYYQGGNWRDKAILLFWAFWPVILCFMWAVKIYRGSFYSIVFPLSLPYLYVLSMNPFKAYFDEKGKVKKMGWAKFLLRAGLIIFILILICFIENQRLQP